MIRQQIGDLLEIEDDGRFFYVVILTNIVMFGGNIVFAHHTDGTRYTPEKIIANRKGFNVCADLLWPKKEGNVTRINKFTELSEFWLTKYAKGIEVNPKGFKEWLIYRIDDLCKPVERYRQLPSKYRGAMDHQTVGFGVLARMILAKHSPNQNRYIDYIDG